ncbi:hypothetical protein, partial [Escherichia coli]|uniref:hypothetical protein n=1 Tax=Escherichia coli TaxID=562 RepID=UPI00136BAD18
DTDGDGDVDNDTLDGKIDKNSPLDGIYDAYAMGSDATATLIDIAANSLWPSSTVGVENSDSEYSEYDHIIGNEVYQSGLFNVTLNTGAQWDTTKTS